MYLKFILAYTDNGMGGPMSVYVSICMYRLLRIRRRRRAVAAPSPRGRYGKFVARQRTAHAKFNQIWSARQNSGSQRQLVEARAEVSLRAEVPWQSWLAVVHEVPAEQRRPSDVEKMRSLSNRQPLMGK